MHHDGTGGIYYETAKLGLLAAHEKVNALKGVHTTGDPPCHAWGWSAHATRFVKVLPRS